MSLYIPAFIRKQLKHLPGAQLPLSYYRKRQKCSHRQKLAACPLPGIVAVELTNACNLSCAKCPLIRSSRKKGFIDDELFIKILRDIESAGTPTEIALSGSGEPTLHPRLVDYVKAARSIPNIGVIGFATNGIELNPPLSQELLDAGLTRLKASLDTDDPETYRRLNGRDVYAQAEENFIQFCEINKSTGNRCKVTLKATLYKNDLSLAKRLKEKWAQHVDQVRITPVHNWGGSITKKLNSNAPVSQPCAMLWQQIQVLWDGQITLCCMDSMEGRFNMGNVRGKNLSHYWLYDTGLHSIRRLHETMDLSTLPICESCDMDSYSDINI